MKIVEQIKQGVLNVVLPDDDEEREEHPWLWLAELARVKGIDVTADELSRLDYDVVFTDHFASWLAGAGQSGGVAGG